MIEPPISMILWNAETDEEIEGVIFPDILVAPRIGEEIHYWQDGTSENASADSGIRRDFIVKRVRHDLRYMPAKGGGRDHYVQTVELWVTELKT